MWGEKEVENVLNEIMDENVPNLKNDIDVQVQKARESHKKMKPNRSTPRHITIIMAKLNR